MEERSEAVLLGNVVEKEKVEVRGELKIIVKTTSCVLYGFINHLSIKKLMVYGLGRK